MKNPETGHLVSRRSFLKLVSAAAGAIAIGGCRTESAATTEPAAESSPSTTTRPVSTTTLEPRPTTTEPGTTVPPALEYLPTAEPGGEWFVLPEPAAGGEMPLVEALWNRRTARDYSSEEIPVHVLSGLLWAGFGVNRLDGRRTAPSALNRADISIYVAAAKGLFRYDAGAHLLEPVLSDDVRSLTVLNQPNVAEAPMQLIYVSDYGRLGATQDQMVRWSWAHTGFIAQNVYLYCASEGLATVVRANFVQQTLEGAMPLGSSDHVTLVQAVGYPRNT